MTPDGTIPSAMSNMSSLRVLALTSNNLVGSIPSFFFNLPRLQRIYLGGNKLSGPILAISYNMPSLQEIDLFSNQLSGRVPKEIGNLTALTDLYLDFNNFEGRLPPEIGNLGMLMVMILSNNSFEGKVPLEIGNLTMLTMLYLSNNHFEGEIPSEVGNLRNLEELDMGGNNFDGTIPFDIFNITTITIIELPLNKLSGHLPSNIGLFLPNLQHLYLGGNKLSGTIPSSISNASQLTELDFTENSFSGLIPRTLGNLRLLQWLNLGFNKLTVESKEVSLFSYLSNCKYLSVVVLSRNPLNIILPNSVGNLSNSLKLFWLPRCNIKGNIPISIGNLSNLISLILEGNELVGPLPSTIGRLRELQLLYLPYNGLEGPIPSDVCHLTSLFYFNLGLNKLSGCIPTCINNLTLLRGLFLDNNKLSSTIPMSLWSLTYLLEIDLSSNSLIGSLSVNVGNMKVLTQLDLSKNQLSGDIPMTIGGLKDLTDLSLADNRLEGAIPESFGELVSLVELELSNNSLSGEIPKSLEALSYLKYLNVSFNRLRGEVPMRGPFVNFTAESFMSNEALCGATRLQLPLCDTKAQKTTSKHLLKFMLPTIGLTILGLILVLVWTRCDKRNTKSTLVDAELSPLAQWRRISQQELIQATDGFSLNNLLGKGSFGSVYKGTLSDGMNIATKVLNLQVEEGFKSFDAECEVLRNVRHRNLLKIISICSNTDFKALVLEYMPRGSLEKWLHSNNHFLNILQRLNIVIDVASALEYLHHGYSTSIVHCDLKPSNVLLDEDMVAHLADFGIAKLLGDGDSMTWTMTLATTGYMAPEYGSQGIVSSKGDMYSFGILLMETFTRRRPTDDMFIGEMSLKDWVDGSLPHAVIDIMDPNLLRNEREDDAVKECISSLMGLAMGCCAESPEQRTNIVKVSATLNKIKLKLVKDIGRS
ncbi:hypothetical protein CJ030_MR3G025344 [Morella rubra]|uniref:non-specific serine/threonine protein kinase n=1 Tax=Morella rubra TaxID=262757 RepID=A0A6A1W732_9ROSI|nr:hypothetical protein CJ030_MR3G025344 [Morella rubra]